MNTYNCGIQVEASTSSHALDRLVLLQPDLPLLNTDGQSISCVYTPSVGVGFTIIVCVSMAIVGLLLGLIMGAYNKHT